MLQAGKCSILEMRDGRTVTWRPVLVTCLDCHERIKEGQNQEAKDEWREERIGGEDYEIFNRRSSTPDVA